MFRRSSLVVLVAFCIMVPKNLFAWGKQGHALVAEIAYSFLDTNTRKAVLKGLDGMTVEDAGNWMDYMRSDHKFDFMKQWHYVNVEKGNLYEATKDDNILNALNTAIEKLKHKSTLSDEEIKRNLLIVFHLVGDLHQPLHVGYGSDKGGNDIQMVYGGHNSNLHRVWDTEIIEGESISINQCLLLYKNFDKSQIEMFKTINVEKWMNQPRALLGSVYAYPEDKVIDQAYIDKNKKIIEQQLLIAGIRLAAILQEVFKA